MKKILVFFAICIMGISLSLAQVNTSVGKRPKPKDTPKVIKDDGIGHRINFGLAFAPTIDWMFPASTGMERNGVSVGMRYGIGINVNLTKKKNFYVSSGVFIEQLGGKLKFIDNILIPISVENLPLTTTEIQRNYQANYLTIPLGVTLKTNSIHNFFIVGNVGLYNSFRLSAFNTDTYTFKNWQTNEPEYWSRQRVKSDEVALLKESVYGGIGMEYSISRNSRAGVTINYVQSLTNYFKGKGKAQNNFTHEDQNAKLGYLEIVLNLNFF
ncbi:MAG: outer membrane beta-barrel protein [Bacteroidales bacterium]|nr:outer membrane beta-barrel protein [Bacteroidales bacterium]